MNRWPPFHRHAYVPINVAFGGLLVLLCILVFDLDRGDLGFVWDGRGLAAGAIGGAAVASPLFLFVRSPQHSRRIADRRSADLGFGQFLYRVVIRIPIGTALFEETVFRGALFGLGMSQGMLFAWSLSAAAFGFWHIAPTLNLVTINRPVSVSSSRWRAAVLAVILTGAGGVFFTFLRVELGGLAAPVGFHSALNSTAAVASYLAWRSSGARISS